MEKKQITCEEKYSDKLKNMTKADTRKTRTETKQKKTNTKKSKKLNKKQELRLRQIPLRK